MLAASILTLPRIVYESEMTGFQFYAFKKNIPTIKTPKLVQSSWSLKSDYTHFLYLVPEFEWQSMEPLKDAIQALNYLKSQQNRLVFPDGIKGDLLANSHNNNRFSIENLQLNSREYFQYSRLIHVIHNDL